ncbi:MAG: FkbM family methyltransferase, partial [Alphaproteobacteria bacterium]
MKEIKGFYWPDSDADCHRAVFDETYKIDKALSLTQGRSVCIQAGGNVGVFPKILAKSFNAVYTWEPDPENFTCLAMNCPEPNIVKFNAALGSHPDMIHVGSPNRQHNNNCGAYQVLGKGIYPTMLVDDLALPACDLIYLDIEGFELF